MQKTWALCALLASAPVLAQNTPAPSALTLYGIMDVSARSTNGLTAGNAPSATHARSVSSGTDNTSRWGLRGSEDLGSGMRTLFQLESGINADTGASINGTKYFDRAAWLGLQGRWGQLTAGRQTTLLADAISPVDPLGMRFAGFNPNVNTAALSQHGLGAQYGSAGSTAGSFRLDNALKYTGRIGAWTAQAMHGLGETAGSGKALSSTGAGLAYAQGELSAAGAFQTFRNAEGRSLDGYTLGAAYRWGTIRLATSAGRSTARTSDTARTTQRVLSAGGTWSATPQWDLTAAYYHVDRTRTGANDDGYGRLVTFAEYKLSRRTRLYAELDATRWRGGYQGPANRRTATGVSAGMVHHF